MQIKYLFFNKICSFKDHASWILGPLLVITLNAKEASSTCVFLVKIKEFSLKSLAKLFSRL